VKNLFSRVLNKINDAVESEDLRGDITFICVDVILALVALIMTVVNIFTGEYIVLASTLIVFLICVGILFLVRAKAPRTPVRLMLYVALLFVLFFYVVSGHPDGFSALWLSLVPMLAMMLMGEVKGSIYSLIAFLILVFFFWTPIGRNLLQYDYNSTFLLRYPFFFVASYMLALATEHVRKHTHKKLVEAKDRYSHLYRHDALTGLYNRYGINEKIRDEIKSGHVNVMIMDIDNFKSVNDTYGHDAGDMVLKNVANIIEQSVCEHCGYARWGGEEFLVVMTCEHSPEEAAEKIRKNVEQSIVDYNGQQIKVTISIGGTKAPDITKTNMNTLVTLADKNLYISKTTGKNKVTFD